MERVKIIRVIFAFEKGFSVDLDELSEKLSKKGERTFEERELGYWFHKIYHCDVNFYYDPDNNLIVANISGEKYYRTVGSFIEWILNNVVGEKDILNAITVVK